MTEVIPSNRDFEFVCFQGHVEEQSIQLDKDRGGSWPVFLFQPSNSQVTNRMIHNLDEQSADGSMFAFKVTLIRFDRYCICSL